MVPIARSRAWLVLPIVTAILLACPTGARADRIDIHDPALLGSVVQRVDLHHGGQDDALINEVRYASGIYSYIYAIQTDPHFPCAFGLCEGEPQLVSFAVTGHPLEGTWGAIYNSNAYWDSDPFPVGGQTSTVERITPVFDGFLVAPLDMGAGTFSVVYRQSLFPPSGRGMLTYTARNYCFSDPSCFDANGQRLYEYDSHTSDGALVPTPEPGSIVLFGFGLAALAARRRARRSPR